MLDQLDSQHFCLTTLAVGNKYRKHALNLASDVTRLCPDTSLVILCDQPDDFMGLANVIPIKHSVRSIGIYHDKLYCLEESLKRFEGCLFLDADCRLLVDITRSRIWKPGITAKSCQDSLKHLRYLATKNKDSGLEKSKIYKLSEKVANKYSVNLKNIKYIGENCFILKKDSNKDEKFLRVWKEIRDLFESNRIYNSEGLVIGIAAQIAELSVYHYDTGYPEEAERHQIDDVYKDRIYLRKKNLPEEIKKVILELNEDREQVEQASSSNIILNTYSRFTQTIVREIKFLKLLNNQKPFKLW